MQPRRVALVAAALVLALGCRSDDPPTASDASDPDSVEVTPAPAALSDAEVIARAGSAVWRVSTEGCAWLGSGSAFAIDANHLVTNRHVVANDVSPDLLSPSGERRSGRVIGASREADIAVIAVDDSLPVTLQWAPTETLQPAEHIVVIGYPAPALEFTATVGSIVNFQGRDGAREAMLTDAPINPGNSGGPGLRTDATVAGVVTQMTLADPGERAAILYTAQSVQDVVEDFIADPEEVLSDCGQGPDYVPPLPEHFDVPSVPPAPPTTATTAPVPIPTAPTTAATATSAPSTTRPAPTSSTAPPCPSGAPVGQVSAYTAEPGAEDGTWNTSTSGLVYNGSNAEVGILEVRVVFAGDEATTLRPSIENGVLRAGESLRFDVAGPVSAADGPAEPVIELDWVWMDPDFETCPNSAG